MLHIYTEFVLERTGRDKVTLSAKKRRGDNNSPLADSQDCEHMKRKTKSSIVQIEIAISARANACLRLILPCHEKKKIITKVITMKDSKQVGGF